MKINFLEIFMMRLKRDKVLQFIITLLPSLCILLYIFTYMFDVANLLSVLNHNNELVNKNMSDLKEVTESSVNKKDISKYDIVIKSDGSIDYRLNYGDLVYSIYIIDKDQYRLELNDENKFIVYTNKLEFIDRCSEKDGSGTVDITVNDNTITFDTKYKFADVFYRENGFLIRFNDSRLEDLTYVSLNNVDILSTNDNTAIIDLSVIYDYKMGFVDKEVNYVSILPTNSVYYDTKTLSFVTNISEDFCWTFIIGSKIILVFVCMLILCLMLGYLKNNKAYTFEILSRKEPLLLNVIMTGLLPIAITITMILFN